MKKNGLHYLVLIVFILAGCSPVPVARDTGSSITPALVETSQNPVKNESTILPAPTSTVSKPIQPVLAWKSFTNANFARAMLVDTKGFLWVGGIGGLVRWNVDTGTYQKFLSENGLGDNFVTAIAEDAENQIWAGTFGGGISRYDGSQWLTFNTEDGLPNNYVTAIAVTPDGKIWAGTPTGLAYFDGNAWQAYAALSGKPVQDVSHLAVSGNGDLWVSGAWDTGLIRISENQNQEMAYGIGNAAVHALISAPDGAIWAGTKAGVSRFDGNNWRHYALEAKENTAVTAIAVSETGEVWAGYSIPIEKSKYWTVYAMREGLPAAFDDRFQGVWHFDGQTWTRIQEADGLASNETVSIQLDTQNRVYFASYANGVAQFDHGNWKTLSTADPSGVNNARFMMSDETGNIWFTADGVVSKIDRETDQVSQYTFISSDEIILSIFGDSKGQLWVGTTSRLLYFDGHQGLEILDENGSSLANIKSIAELPNGEMIFIPTEKAPLRYDGSSWASFDYFSDRADIHNLYVDREGNIWFLGGYGAIYAFNQAGEKQSRFTQFISSDEEIKEITQTADGNIWAISSRQIAELQDNQWKTVFTLSGKTDRDPICIFNHFTSDADGNLWLSTNCGLLKFSDSDRLWFTVKDGLADNDTDEISFSAGNTIWVDTGAGISKLIIR